MDFDDYKQIGNWFAIPIAIVIFIGAWWYCTATYGFLFGFGLGWLPSAILANIMRLLAVFLWPLIVMTILYIGYLIVSK